MNEELEEKLVKRTQPLKQEKWIVGFRRTRSGEVNSYRDFFSEKKARKFADKIVKKGGVVFTIETYDDTYGHREEEVLVMVPKNEDSKTD